MTPLTFGAWLRQYRDFIDFTTILECVPAADVVSVEYTWDTGAMR